MGNEWAIFFFFFLVPCFILLVLKGYSKLILKFEGGPYGFKKKSKSAKLKTICFFFFRISGQ